MKKIRRFFDKINIYGLDFHLRYKKEKKYSTIFDVFLSLIFIFILLFLSYSYLKNIFIFSDFTIVTNSIQLKGKTSIDLSNIPIIFGIADYRGKGFGFNEQYINANLYKTNHEFSIKNKKVNRTQIKIKLEKCKKENLLEYFYDNVKKSFNISNFLCISKGQNLTIAGKYGDTFNWFDILEFHIKRCENTTELSICKNDEEINSYLANSYINVIYLSYFVDHFNKSNPVNYAIESSLFIMSLHSVKKYFYYFTPTKYKSENGLIFNNVKTYNFYEYKKTLLDYNEKEENSYFSSKTLMEIIFTVYPHEINYNRRYIKLQEVLGDIGGCIDILFGIFKIISSYFSEKSFLIEISNTFFNQNKISKFNKSVNNNLKKENTLKEKYSYTKNLITINNNSMKISCDDSINKLNNLDNKLNLINNFVKKNSININHKKSTSIISFKGKNKTKFTYSIIDYCMPFYLMKKISHKQLYYCYENILKKYMSIEVMIPILERSSNNLIGDKYNFYFKTDSFLEIK